MTVGSAVSAFTASVPLMAIPFAPTSTLMVTPFAVLPVSVPPACPAAAAWIFGIRKEYWPSSVGFSSTVTASVLPSGM